MVDPAQNLIALRWYGKDAEAVAKAKSAFENVLAGDGAMNGDFGIEYGDGRKVLVDYWKWRKMGSRRVIYSRRTALRVLMGTKFDSTNTILSYKNVYP